MEAHPRIAEEGRWLDYHKKRKGLQDQQTTRLAQKDAIRDWEFHRRGVAFQQEHRLREKKARAFAENKAKLAAQQKSRLSATYQTAAYRFYDNPIRGTIFRLPDIPSLVRGVTFTIMPDGKHMRVPTMNRLVVKAQNQQHADTESGDIMQALQDILKGKKPVDDRARFDHVGRVRRGGGRERAQMPDAGRGRGGLRPVPNLLPRG